MTTSDAQNIHVEVFAKARIFQSCAVKLRRGHEYQLGNTQVVEVDTRVVELFEFHFCGEDVHVFVVACYVNNVFGLQDAVGHGHALFHVTYETAAACSLAPNLHHAKSIAVAEV